MGFSTTLFDWVYEMALEQELATYNAKLESLLPNEGRFVLIHGDEVVGIFDSYSDALSHAYGQFGVEPFLVRKISSIETISFFTRSFTPACHISP